MSKIFIVLTVFVLVAIGGFFVFKYQANAPEVSLSPSGTIQSSSPAPSVSQTPKQTPKKTPAPTAGQTTPQEKIWQEWGSKPATCQLKGSIQFIQPGLFDNKDSLFSYQGIDSEARLILWKVVPDDDLRIGPNIFGKLPIPNGQSLLTVSLPEKPKSKHYDLYAQVTYSRLEPNGGIRNSYADCTGKIGVDVPF